MDTHLVAQEGDELVLSHLAAVLDKCFHDLSFIVSEQAQDRFPVRNGSNELAGDDGGEHGREDDRCRKDQAAKGRPARGAVGEDESDKGILVHRLQLLKRVRCSCKAQGVQSV